MPLHTVLPDARPIWLLGSNSRRGDRNDRQKEGQYLDPFLPPGLRGLCVSILLLGETSGDLGVEFFRHRSSSLPAHEVAQRKEDVLERLLRDPAHEPRVPVRAV
jgi:hypothetical protein